ncbi:hypothetical protein [Brucella pituitosa]|uniref:Uncharacterized protein n=1 Tax=Brucella pituitosa TaxID=571256 RepID=A0A643EU46_9HYPH|nr:hypothetical protein [Brucella pituitosa]KAB0566156.1 hypothetical protein F7Q93_22220 [Brucella pituitosa]
MRLTREIYLLDPLKRTLFILETSSCKTITEIKKAIDCESVDAILLDGEHVLYFDDEGLKPGIDNYTIIEGHPDPLVGKILIMHRELEESVLFADPQEILSKLRSYRPVVDPIIQIVETGSENITTFLSAVNGFTARIVEIDLVVRRLSMANVDQLFSRGGKAFA